MRSFLSIRLLCLVVFGLIGYYAFAQNVAPLFEKYNDSHHTEKIYIHTDSDFYFPESTVYGKVYLVHSSDHTLIDTTVLVHVDLIAPSGEILEQLTLLSEYGTANFSIQSDLSFDKGKYVIRGYTQYQRNFDSSYIFQKEIQFVYSPNDVKRDSIQSDSIIVDFFPEGGHLVTGLTSVVAYKATNENGDAVVINGHIEDDSGMIVGKMSHHLEGLGKCRFLVIPGKIYTAVIPFKNRVLRFELPHPISKGYTLKVTTRVDEIILDCHPNDAIEGEEIEVLGHIRGQLFLSKTIEGSAPRRYVIDKSTLPSGILHFTIFDKAGRPLAERLVFNDNPSEVVDVDIQIEKKEFSTRSKINGTLYLSSHGKGSMAIYSTEVLNQQLQSIDIKSYLLLQSDLRGKVANIHKFFDMDDEGFAKNIDLLLLTHGWRKFQWQDVLSQQLPAIVYPPETSTTLAGEITMKHNDKSTQANVAITLMSDSLFANLHHTTGEDGVFYFTGLDLRDTTDIVIQASKHKAKKKKKDKRKDEIKISGNRYVKIKMLDWDELEYDSSSTLELSIIDPVEEKRNIITNEEEISNEELENNQNSIFDGAMWSLDIDEVVVKSNVSRGQKRNLEAQRRYQEKNMFFFASTDKFIPDEPQFDQFNWKNVYEMIRTVVPPAHIIQEDGIQKIVHRSGGVASIVIDGEVQPDNRAVLLDPDHVAMIDVLLSPRSSALYDVPVAIVLITKNDAEKAVVKKDGVMAMTLPGYHRARTYYSPDYSISALNEPDIRTTLEWDPNVNFYGEPYNFEFYSGDILGDFIISVEGITEDGFPFVSSEVITVKE